MVYDMSRKRTVEEIEAEILKKQQALELLKRKKSAALKVVARKEQKVLDHLKFQIGGCALQQEINLVVLNDDETLNQDFYRGFFYKFGSNISDEQKNELIEIGKKLKIKSTQRQGKE